MSGWNTCYKRRRVWTKTSLFKNNAERLKSSAMNSPANMVCVRSKADAVSHAGKAVQEPSTKKRRTAGGSVQWKFCPWCANKLCCHVRDVAETDEPDDGNQEGSQQMPYVSEQNPSPAIVDHPARSLPQGSATVLHKPTVGQTLPMGPPHAYAPDYSGYTHQAILTSAYSGNMQSNSVYSTPPTLVGFERSASEGVGRVPTSFDYPLVTPSMQNYGQSSTDMGSGIPLTSPYDSRWEHRQQRLSMAQHRIWTAQQHLPMRRTCQDTPSQHDRPTNITNFVLTSDNAMETAQDIKDVQKLLGKCNVSEGKKVRTARERSDVEDAAYRLRCRQIIQEQERETQVRIKNVRELLTRCNIYQRKPEHIETISNVEELEMIMHRGFGAVQRVCHRQTGQEFAMKTIDLREAAGYYYQDFLRELEILPAINCEYIIEGFGAFLGRESLHLVTELMDISMRQLLDVTGLVPEECLSWIAFSVLRAVSYLEKELNTLHRDIAPRHILANRAGQVKLCDLTLTGKIEDDVALEVCGRVSYMAPERFEEKPYSVLADVWSIGVTLAELGTGHYPYPPSTDMDTTTLMKKMQLQQDNNYEEIRQLAFGSRLLVRQGLTIGSLSDYVVKGPSASLPVNIFGEDVRDFVAQCLVKEANERASIDALMHHSFLSDAVSSPDESRNLFASFIAKVLDV